MTTTRISRLIKAGLRSASLRPSELAYCLNVSRGCVYRLENALMKLPIDKVLNLSLALQLDEKKVIDAMTLDLNDELWDKLHEQKHKKRAS